MITPWPAVLKSAKLWYYDACARNGKRGCASATGVSLPREPVLNPSMQRKSMLTLYYAPHTCSLASHIALEDAGASYALKRVDIDKGEHRARDYLTVNPKGRVPALATPRGILTETPAILAFMAQSFPDARLARRSFRLRRAAGVQQLPLLHAPRRTCASHARASLG